MSNRFGLVHGIALGLLVVGAALHPAHADWLVMREGGRVETKGPWQMKGKLVVFTRAADDALASLRATEVDLDASAKATAEAKVQAEAPPQAAAPQKKIAVLTDKDFHKTAPVDAAKPDAPPAKTGPLVVSDYRKLDRPTGDGIAVEGTVHNSTGDMMVNASVEVQLFNEAGERVGTAPGLLTSTSIQPDGSVQFRANFPGVFTYATAKFDVNGLPLNMNPVPADKDKSPDAKPDQKPQAAPEPPPADDQAPPP